MFCLSKLLPFGSWLVMRKTTVKGDIERGPELRDFFLYTAKYCYIKVSFFICTMVACHFLYGCI
jgi:hypothetical protein